MNNHRIPSFLGLCAVFALSAMTGVAAGQGPGGTTSEASEAAFMSEAYRNFWNAEVQAQIDRDIEKHRMADAVLRFEDLPAGTEVAVRQTSHDFVFGAQIFNFNQLGSVERNQKYKDLFGTLFNSATVPFYWKTFEMTPGHPRFMAEERDTEKYWNQVEDPYGEPHWRRPATDPIVEFCEKKGVRMHGHPIVWGNRLYHQPEWVFEKFCPEDEKEKLSKLSRKELYELTPAQIGEMLPVYTREINRLMHQRISELAGHYGDRIQSWDVVNESIREFTSGNVVPGDKVTKTFYGGPTDKALMPGDYAFESLKAAERLFPENVLLNINEGSRPEYPGPYVDQINDLRSRGAKIDIMGVQSHTRYALQIARGAHHNRSPELIWKQMENLSKAGLPIHLSEITINSPEEHEHGLEMQALIARNLYRIWFGIENMMGITWWNLVDGGGAAGESTESGLFTRDMEPKPAFWALNKLINEEWKTNTTTTVGEDGTATFRGFRGRYEATWTDKDGNVQTAEFHLKNDGDGF